MRANPRTLEHLQAAMAALYGPPMTDAESREYRRLIAREMARAEAKRRGERRQMELPE